MEEGKEKLDLSALQNNKSLSIPKEVTETKENLSPVVDVDKKSETGSISAEILTPPLVQIQTNSASTTPIQEEKKTPLIQLKVNTSHEETPSNNSDTSGKENSAEKQIKDEIKEGVSTPVLSPSEGTSPAQEESGENKKIAESPQTETIKVPKINFSAMQKTIEAKEQKSASEKAAKAQKAEAASMVVPQEKTPELFTNYKPSFDGSAKKFFEQLKQIRIRPKTRNSLVFGLIFIALSAVGYAFYFHPDHHSLKIYKTNIIGVFNKLTNTQPPVIETPVVEDLGTSTGETQQPQENQDNTGTISEGSGTTESGTTISDSGGKLDDAQKEKIKNYFFK